VSLQLLMDAHIEAEITQRLRARGVDVLTAQEDGADLLSDPLLLDRATELGRVLFTYDQDFCGETARRLREGVPFFAVFYAHSDRSRLKEFAEWLEMYAVLMSPEEVRGRLIFIP